MRKTFLFSALLIGLFLAACSPGDIPVTSEPPDGQLVTPTPTRSLGEMEEGAAFVDSADLLVMESYPVQIRLHVVGNLPTPCHHFQSEVTAANDQNEIHVRIYSLVNPTVMCTQVLQPFDESVSIPMDGAADGIYSVWLNGELVGEFSYPG